MLGSLTIAALWVCLWHSRIRLAGIPVLILATGILLWQSDHDIPDLIISGEDKGKIAIITEEGAMFFSAGHHRSNYENDTWKRRAGIIGEGKRIK